MRAVILHRKYLPSEMAALAAILLVAAVFRFWQIDKYPRALHFDEAINGLVAQDLLRGTFPELLTYDRAREPMIFYWMAPAVFIFGPTPGALRVATAAASLAVVAGVWALARELFGRRIGLLTALICATTVWPIYHGRLATRSILVPLVMSLALCVSARAWRARKLWQWIVAGVLLGAVFYTYASNLFIVPTVLLTLAGLLAFNRRALLERKREILWAAILFIGIGVPIFVFRATHPSSGPGRPGTLSVFYPGQSATDFAKTVITQTVLVGRMFFLKGDFEIRHNIPYRPAFDWLMAAPFVVGLFAAWTPKRRAAAGLFALWMAVWLLPTFLAKDAPHFLRSSGTLAFLFAWPAIGLMWIQKTIAARGGRWAGLMIGAALMGGSILITTRDYLFSNFLASPEVTEAFFGNDVATILEFSRQHRTGWVGDNLFALPAPVDLSALDRAQIESLPQPYAQYLLPWAFDPSLKQY